MPRKATTDNIVGRLKAGLTIHPIPGNLTEEVQLYWNIEYKPTQTQVLAYLRHVYTNYDNILNWYHRKGKLGDTELKAFKKYVNDTLLALLPPEGQSTGDK